ncbi:MAG TPA: hypothetical protein VI979_02265 [archaeon]|nr:hypothetical protein [archaeon]
MGVDYSKIFGGALRYAFSIDKLLPMFALYSAMLLSLVFAAGAMSNAVGTGTNAVALSLIGAFAVVGIIFLVILFAGIFLHIAYVHNAFRHAKGSKEKLSASYDYAKSKYLKALGAVAIVYAVSLAAGIALFPLSLILALDSSPAAAIAKFIIENGISVIVSMFLLLYYPIIVLESKGLIDSLKESFRTFMSNKKSVFLYLIIAGLIAGAIMAAIVALVIAGFLASVPDGTDMTSIIAALNTALPYFALLSLPVAALMAYMQVFYMASLTFLYAQLRGTKGKK